MEEPNTYRQTESTKLYNSVHLKITELIESHTGLESKVRNLELILRNVKGLLARGELDEAMILIDSWWNNE